MLRFDAYAIDVLGYAGLKPPAVAAAYFETVKFVRVLGFKFLQFGNNDFEVSEAQLFQADIA
jgi:hypothetical protein